MLKTFISIKSLNRMNRNVSWFRNSTCLSGQGYQVSMSACQHCWIWRFGKIFKKTEINFTSFSPFKLTPRDNLKWISIWRPVMSFFPNRSVSMALKVVIRSRRWKTVREKKTFHPLSRERKGKGEIDSLLGSFFLFLVLPKKKRKFHSRFLWDRLKKTKSTAGLNGRSKCFENHVSRIFISKC